jgi:hypothetical protein
MARSYCRTWNLPLRQPALRCGWTTAP